MRARRVISIWLTALALLASTSAWAAPEADLWPRWQAHDAQSEAAIDHGAWSEFLDQYLVTDHPSGINRLRYAQVSEADHQALQAYLDRLQSVPISDYNRAQQKAYWVNLYNAKTVELVVEHYPVDSIKDITFGWFSFGPWSEKLVTVEGVDLSLNDIEHRILRPIWQDPRIHYAVNCASLGCPNLAARAYTAQAMDGMLRAGAQAYVNHPRGVSFEDGELVISSIYEWFKADFGGTRKGVLEHLAEYAEPPLAERLRAYEQAWETRYDWALNKP